MSLTSKLLMSTVIATSVLSANTVPSNATLLKYIKRNIVKNPQVSLEGIKVLETKTHKDLPGWTVLLTTMSLKFQGKKINAPETIFVKDGLMTGHLVNQKTGNDYKDDIKPSVPNSMYNANHLLFGNKNAKHKILVFSDPMCPFCQEVIPEIFKAAKAHPETLAVYYYHLPLLRIHPVSGILTRVMHLAQEKGKLDVVEKMYTLKIDPKETNMKKVLSAVQKHTGFSVTEAEVKSADSSIKADEKAAAKLMVSGTPAVYIDGEWDKMRNGYEKFIK